MIKQNQDKEKDVNPVKKLFSYVVMFAIGCWLLNYGIRLLSAVWLPLLFLGIFVILLTVGWRVHKARKDWG
ncbi:hypothetical protein [Candidatus Enterococcus clewellii]|uniref:Uncharacterized protein n=1 Tax=Candidatus Enterococcus clewellii TaxID=1834193 RepID=A0A242K2S2_9ENTE|nr:hypothetical protein [Enterococcus sp. 9E7_DIV0242]OTP12794.1 hypothetical protein A5888_003373 [Enterococcus sp. 9E7_DIV0242]